MIHTSIFQTWVVKKVTSKLSANLHANVSIKRVDFQLFNKMLLESTLVLDKKNDTLLYAGAAKLNITDWFFFKNNVTLKYVGLDDAVIYLNRKDSVWNYQFLADYFSGPKKKDTARSSINLDLKILELNHVKLWQKDLWKGEDMYASVDKMLMYTDDFDLNNNVLKINTIHLERPVFAQYDYDGLRDALPKHDAGRIVSQSKGLQWNSSNWLMQVKDLTIQDGNVDIEKSFGTISPANYFDENHILFSSVNGNFENVLFEKDTITAKIDLSAKERSGLEVKKLQAVFKFTPALMEFRDLDLVTNRSHLKNYYSMKYADFNTDMGNFVHAVTLESHFTNSSISSDDLAFFSSGLKTWKREFLVSGDVKGTIDHLHGTNMIIQSGKNNYLNGDIDIRGLPATSGTFIDFNSRDSRTTYADLATLFPDLRGVTNPNLSALGNIGFKGTFSGFLNDFVTYGTVSTSLGTLVTDLNMKIPSKGAPVYSGKIATNSFALGKFINSGQLGNISFKGKVSGKGFTSSTVDIAVDGNIKQVEFNNYNYQNIIAKGNYRNNIFQGTMSIDDPNVKVDGIAGFVNFSTKSPQFNLQADVQTLHSQSLHFTNENFIFSGKLDFNFSGNNIDNFLGSAKIYNAMLTSNKQQLSFDSLALGSYFLEGKKFLTVQTNELTASVVGNFKILDLPDAFQLFLNKYYPAYILKPRRQIQEQDFTFSIHTKNISDYIGLIDKRLKGFDNSVIEGNVNLPDNKLNIKISTPSFSYANINFNNVNFTGAGTLDSLTLAGNVDDVIINDSLHLPDTKISVSAHNDISDISIKTSASKTLNEADLSLRLQTMADGFRLYFNPSSFVINDKKWILEKGGELVLSRNVLTASQVKFIQENQELTISTEPSSTGSSNDVLVDLKQINISDFAPFFLKRPRLEGLITGDIRVNDPFGNVTVDFDTRADQFRFEDDSIGILKTSGNYSSVSGNLFANAISDNALYNFTADMTWKTKDSTNAQLKGTLNLSHSNIHILEKYLSGIFSGIHGNATGQLVVSGKASDPKITGKVTLNDAGLTVDYTRCRYLFQDNSVINFNTDEIDFGTITIKDTLNNTATVSGKLYHTFFDNFFFNELHFKTDSRGNNPGKFVLLNTSSLNNKEFYGHLIGSADLTLNGPVTDMRMLITGEPTDSSHIYLPTGETAESGKIDYIEFTKLGREMNADLSARQDANIKVDMELTANPLVQIDVILDEVTKDIINARGNGKLIISAGTRDPLTIRGRYDVQQGNYTFNFQTFLKTPFTLQQGFIEWQGDPYLANLNIDAVYRATKVDLSSIPTSTGNNRSRGDVDIIFKLRGTLKDPRPDFEFQFPFDNPLRSDPIANEYIKTRFQADKNYLNQQVTALLLFNTFINDQQGLINANNTGNFVTRSLGQVLSNTLSSSLSSVFRKLFKTNAVDLYTNINTSDFNFGGSQGITPKEIQNLGNFGFKTSFLKNRLLINFGGNVDYKLIQSSNNSNSNFLFTPDVSFEYLITPDGKFRVVGFNRSDAAVGDITGLSRLNRTGVLLSYRKDFNTFAELIGVRKKNR